MQLLYQEAAHHESISRPRLSIDAGDDAEQSFIGFINHMSNRPTCGHTCQNRSKVRMKVDGHRCGWQRAAGRPPSDLPGTADRRPELRPSPRRFALLSMSAPLLITGLLASLFFAGLPATVMGATFAGIGKVVGGDGGTHRLTVSTNENGAELLQVLNDFADPKEMTRGRDPSLGVATWNSVEKFYYYAAAEDGFASAYVTPYSYVTNRSQSQRVVRGRTDTSFTLTSIQYNPIDGYLYGLITYSSGEHFMVRVQADTRTGAVNVELTFEALLQLDYSHIVPGLSAMAMYAIRRVQVYYGIGIKTIQKLDKVVQQGYLFALQTGVVSTGPRTNPSHLWNRELPGVLTSLHADPNTGNLYGMLHNVSGHFLLHFDPNNNGQYWGEYEYLAPSEIRYNKPEPSELFTLSPDAEVIFGISSYSPPSGTGREAEADYFSVVFENYIDENGTNIEQYNLLDMNLANQENTRINPNVTSEELAISDEAGYTMTSLQVMYTTIPMLDQLVPSTAHIVGGMLVTVVGQPFVDTGPGMIRCRWRMYEGTTKQFNGQILNSVSASFVNSSVIICKTPSIFTRTKGMLDLTLTNGAIWTRNAKAFTFFETTMRLPQFGSSKGRALVQIKGLYMMDIPVEDVDYTNNRGKPAVVRDKLFESQCEFGEAPNDYSFDDKAVSTGKQLFQVQGNAPVGPVFRKAQCMNVTVGLTTEEICVVTCQSPPMPADQCIEGSKRACTLFAKQCPKHYDKSITLCKMSLAPYETIPFSFVFYGQRIPLGSWGFNGDQSPVVEGAKFTEDGTGIIIQFDLDTNKGRIVGGRVDAGKIILRSALLFGQNSYITYVLRSRILVTLGHEAQGTEDSFFDLRPAALGARFNWFRFAMGTFVLDSVADDEKRRPVAHIIAPGTSSQCAGLKIKAGASSFSGGRPMDYRWGFRASKCIDFMCLNTVALDEKAHLWMLPGQRSLYYTRESDFEAEPLVTGVLRSLDVVSNNKLTWMLQTTNFFYKSYIEDSTRMIKGEFSAWC